MSRGSSQLTTILTTGSVVIELVNDWCIGRITAEKQAEVLHNLLLYSLLEVLLLSWLMTGV